MLQLTRNHNETDKTDKTDKTELNELLQQLDVTIKNLESKRLHLKEQLHQARLSNGNDNKKDVDTNTVARKINDARDLEGLEKLIEQFDSKIDQAYSTRDNFAKLGQLLQLDEVKSQDKLNEEGLPFMDIQEEVDEDGNVISAKVNEKVVDTHKDSNRQVNDNVKENINKNMNRNINRNINKNVEERTSTKTDTLASQFSNNNKNNGNDFASDDELQLLLRDMELTSRQPNHQILDIDQDELLEKIDKLEISPQEKFDLKRICLDAYRNIEDESDHFKKDAAIKSTREHGTVSGSLYPTPAISREDMLELELIADDFDPQEDYDEEEEMDYDFEEVEEEEEEEDEEDEDDDYANSLLYGRGSYKPNPVLPTNPKFANANKMLWQQVGALRSKKALQDKILDKKKDEADGEALKKNQRSVRFAETVDVKNVENISDALRNPPPEPRKQSLFKQSRILNIKDVERQAITRKVGDVNAEDGHVSTMQTSATKSISPVSDIKENDGANEVGQESPVVNKPKSRFKAMREKNNDHKELDQEGQVVNESKSKSKPKSRFRAMREGSQESSDRLSTTNIGAPSATSTSIELSAVDQKPFEPESEQIRDTRLDYASMNNDLDTMAKAYILGMYDDDISTTGPVVEQLDDFETLNKMVEAGQGKRGAQSEKARFGNGSESLDNDTINEIGMDYIDGDNMDIDEEGDDGKIMTDDIVEHAFDSDSDSDSDDDNSEGGEGSKRVAAIDADEVNLAEVLQNYHRLRQKLILEQNGFKRAAEKRQEFVPVDEDGNEVKMSRFKAGRLVP